MRANSIQRPVQDFLEYCSRARPNPPKRMSSRLANLKAMVSVNIKQTAFSTFESC
jgi:hypothetical protein